MQSADFDAMQENVSVIHENKKIKFLKFNGKINF